LGGGIWSYHATHISPVFAFDIITGVEMILMTMLGGIGTLWGPILGAFIFIPASDLILFQFGSTTIHLTILGGLMMVILLFLPQGILPTISGWLEKHQAPRAAHTGARTMAEMHNEQPIATLDTPVADVTLKK
jgi:branched-chain amino acid transport system permease protein